MSARLVPGSNGRSKIILAHASGALAEIYRHGAHVTSWIPAHGREALFLGSDTPFTSGDSIRGGIPVIFPQFAGLGPLPQHGFARNREWEVVDDTSGGGHAAFELRDSAETRKLWPHAFIARVSVELGEKSLAVCLRVENGGESNLIFTAALHTYIRVGDVRRVRVTGLSGINYRDRNRSNAEVNETGDALTVSGPVNRIYANVPGPLEIADGDDRRISVTADRLEDVVVWNPWTQQVPGMSPDDYLRMICVESAQISQPVALRAGESWTGTQRLELR